MSRLWNYLIFQGWMSYLMAAGLLMFTGGFLLHRVARTERTECTPCAISGQCDAESILQDAWNAGSVCLERKARVVLLVVDALKYEYATWYDDEASSSHYHRNKLPVIRELLWKQPAHSRLYKFVADPPTTTMQRLKGLATGSLPTFIDIGSNFASESIDEDNIVDQNSGGGVVFMGDDTWTNLFPGKFKRQFPSPSFNVWDLDTVDKAVRYRIFFEIKKNDWTLLVAHVLGIDHCGHKHGTQHPEMTRKLNDTNGLIKEIVDSLEKDMILIVIGDHGATENGDHGGDSPGEVEAAMFVYSRIPLLKYSTLESVKSVNQIDLVPTLASILGTPVPFSNLGSVIVEALPSGTDAVPRDDFWYALHSVWRNIVQTKKYIDAYSADTYLFSKDRLQKLEETYDGLSRRLKDVKSTEEFESFVTHSNDYFALLKDTCTEAWVQFDSSLMSKGLLLLFCTIFFFYLFITGVPESRLVTIFKSSFLKCSLLANLIAGAVILCLFSLDMVHEVRNSMFFATGAVSILLLVVLVVQNWDVVSTRWYDRRKMKKLAFVARLVLALTICGLFSNSYIVEEDNVLSFLLVTLICLVIFTLREDDSHELAERRLKYHPKAAAKPTSRMILIVIGLIACLSVRLSYYFWQCREEQFMCSAFVSNKAGAIMSSSLERVSLAVTLVTLALYITIVRLWLQNCGNLSGFAPSVMLGRYCPVLVGVSIGCYWVLERLPRLVKMKLALSWQLDTLPNMIYALCLLAILVLYYRPLSIYLVPKKRESVSLYHDENLVPRLFEKIKDSIYRKKVDLPEKPIVYGLGTAYSASFVLLSVFLTLLYSLLLGHVLSPSTFLMFTTCASVLGLSAMERYRNANSIPELLDVPTPTLLCWFLIAEYFFYGTGHQATFPTIHWDAAFTGTGGHCYGNLFPAILIGINTFGSHIILGASLPLLVVVPFTLYLIFPKWAKLKFPEDGMKRGELLLFEQDSAFHAAVFSAAGRYTLLHAIRVFCSMLAATIHCRHLMVWKIFAPKLIFGAIGFLVTLCSVLASFCMVLRIDKQMDQLIKRVMKNR